MVQKNFKKSKKVHNIIYQFQRFFMLYKHVVQYLISIRNCEGLPRLSREFVGLVNKKVAESVQVSN